ncbi:hypothetical protein [Paludisphaera soli]|uniref:hypothetical protein n=1 Tax=Paludisphaera soli TaxID=2712865 RepID=UPI0013EDA535|nr:hypothetical protein [Paludisphaera soli]
MDAKRGPDPVGRAVDGLRRAVDKLIDLSKSPDGAVRAGAADALRGLDTPPVGALIEVPMKAEDVGFKIEIIEVPGGQGEAYRTHLLLAVGGSGGGGPGRSAGELPRAAGHGSGEAAPGPALARPPKEVDGLADRTGYVKASAAAKPSRPPDARQAGHAWDAKPAAVVPDGSGRGSRPGRNRPSPRATRPAA